MRKQCDGREMLAITPLGAIWFYCTKRANHFGRHKDAYGGTWRKEGK